MRNLRGKRTEQISVRVTSELRQILTEEAEKLDWSRPKLIEKILMDWVKHRHECGGSISLLDREVAEALSYYYKIAKEAEGNFKEM